MRRVAAFFVLACIARGQEPASPAPPAPPKDVAWAPLTPVKLVSSGGATFTKLFDGSILVGGANPDKEVWTLDFETDLKGITALRLEALPDESLSEKGPGRASNGNFVLNELRLEASAKLALRFKPVALQNASCDFIEGRRKPAQVHDGDEVTGANGWAVWGAVGKEHQLVVETASDLRFDGPTLLRCELHFNWGAQHALGRFRIMATTAPRPVRVPGTDVGGGADAPGSWSKLQERINAAIDRGVDYLVSQQQFDGSWNHEQWTYKNGATALAVYTLAKSGVNHRHPAILRALEFMRGQPSRETYTLGCHLMALGALDDPAHRPWMKELCDLLLSTQRDGFAYPWGANDLSNTQYGVLGLRAAAMHGVKVPPEAFEEAATQALEFAAPEGNSAYGPMGFTYNKTSKPTSSMTVAGILVLAVAEEQLKGRSKSLTHSAIAKRGVEWLVKHWSVEQNQFEAHDRWNIYYLYGLERIGSVLGLETIGGHDWYREGARRLVDIQGGKGEWSSAYADQVIDTCFALLFLDRATAIATGASTTRVKVWGGDDPGLPVSVRASGDTPLTFWISSFGEKELATHEWPQDDGRGLRVKKVEWFATGGTLGDRETKLATIEKDGRQPAGRERFGAQWSFSLPGAYQIVVRVTVLSPPESSGPDGGADDAVPAEVVLASPPLAVKIQEALDPELFEYAKDVSRNLLAGQKVTASASSQINGDWVPAHAVDNLQCRGWAATNDDPIPLLTLELEKPVRATTCLLTPANVGDAYGSRITKIALTVNGKLPPLLVDVPATGERRKVRFRFPAQVVRKLEVKILSRQECANPEKAVGIAEVELQVEKPGAAGS